MSLHTVGMAYDVNYDGEIALVLKRATMSAVSDR